MKYALAAKPTHTNADMSVFMHVGPNDDYNVTVFNDKTIFSAIVLNRRTERVVRGELALEMAVRFALVKEVK